MRKNTIHLICNSHIDPVWLWEWPEGAAVTLATFRTAADLCEEFEGFVFNHNEAILYKWIEDPKAIKPATIMPTIPMTAEERLAIVQYLTGLK